MNVVSAQGFEPRTHALEGRCSIQLSYAPTIVERETRFELGIKELQSTALPLGYVAVLGDPSATRTRDTLIKSQVLYRLS